jgi:predicted acyl esterase
MRAWGVAAAVVAVLAAVPAAAPAATATRQARVKMSDGVTLQATVTGQAPLSARPTIVEFSPYGPGSGTTSDGPAYNYLLVQIRGTGHSDGRFDALGQRTQRDVEQTLRWACRQSWSDGRLGLNGFSASAITVYNSLHYSLPCVRTAVLRSGTFELYRDLLWPGGISNAAPAAGVLGLIAGPAIAAGPERAGRDPGSGVDTTLGLTNTGIQAGLAHPALDAYWRERGFRGDANHLPILMLDSFFDVESRGAFQAYQALRGDGAHLLVVGAHDGAPAGTDDGNGATKQWFDRYLQGVSNGVEAQPRVQMLMSDGDREDYLDGRFVRYSAGDWPVPGTQWRSLWLAPGGSLAGTRPAGGTTQSYAAVPSEPSMTDQPNAAIVGPDGLNQLAHAAPALTETGATEPQSLTYSTAPLDADLPSAGPAALDLRLSSTAGETAIWAVISDVWPDGSAHPVATGRLSAAYPRINRNRSLVDAQGDVVQPYGEYGPSSRAPSRDERTYHVELWPIGNRFKRGHRIRLTLVGASAASRPSAPAVNTVRLGTSRLLLPVLP